MYNIDYKQIREWYELGYSVSSDVKGYEGHVLLTAEDEIAIYYPQEERKIIPYFNSKCGAYVRNNVVVIYDAQEVFAEHMGS